MWAEAVNTCCYTRNLIVTKQNEISPHELWHGKRPNVSHLRKFGSKAFVVKPKIERSKFGPKIRIGYLVGYQWECKSYRIFYSETKHVIVERHVTFDENSKCKSIKKDTKVKQVVIEDDSEEEKEIVKSLQDEKLLLIPTVELENVTDITTSNSVVENEESFYEDCFDEEKKDQKQIENSNEECKIGRSSRREGLRENPKKVIPFQYSFLAESVEPSTYEEARNCKHKDKWMEAIKDELDSLEKNGTWEMCKLPEGKKPIESMWIFKVKYLSDGTIDRYKARLVVKGCFQKPGIDFDDLYAPVAQFDSIRTLLSVDAVKNYKMVQFDIKTAFLLGDLDHEIYMKPPQGYNCKSGQACLLKSHYMDLTPGLPRSRQNVLSGGNFGPRAKQLRDEWCALAYSPKIRRDKVRNIKCTSGPLG